MAKYAVRHVSGAALWAVIETDTRQLVNIFTTALAADVACARLNAPAQAGGK